MLIKSVQLVMTHSSAKFRLSQVIYLDRKFVNGFHHPSLITLVPLSSMLQTKESSHRGLLWYYKPAINQQSTMGQIYLFNFIVSTVNVDTVSANMLFYEMNE